MAIVIKTPADILPLSEELIARLDQLKARDIDTSEMPELTQVQLARLKPALKEPAHAC